MTDEQLNAIEQRAGAATIEPLVRKLERAVINTEDDKAYFSLLPMLKTMKALVMDTPALIAEVRRLRDLVAELEEMKAVAVRVDQSWRRNYCDCVNERNAAEDEAKELRAGLDEYKQYEQIAIDNAYTKDTVMNAKRDEIVRLRNELDRFVLTADEDDTIEVLIQRLRRTTSDGELYGIEEQDAQMRYMLRSTFAALMADVRTFRADIERIGRERDQMVAANVELQERLSALEDDGK